MSQRTNNRCLSTPHEPAIARVFIQFALVLNLFMLLSAASAQNSGQDVFSATDEARVNAESADAPSLSPGAYSRGIEEYESAKSAYEKGKNPEKVDQSLARARDYFRQSIGNSAAATSILDDAIKSRAAAGNAGATRVAPEDFATAEKRFLGAARALEKNDIEAGRELGSQADKEFRIAELNALRAQYFSEARRLISEAEQKKAAKFAPRTFDRAKTLLSQADTALTENRYEKESAIALADQASYEARHALYLTDLVRLAKSGSMSTEDIILDWESPLLQIAGALAIEPDLTAGHSDTTEEVLETVQTLLGLPDEIAERDRLIAGLEEELREMDTQLGGASAERVALVQRLEHQRRVREQFELVETMFSPEEAKILRAGDRLIVRLVGLSFASNSSQLDVESVMLMRKVETAIGVFPRCTLVIEGHTDSQGNADRNLKLSIARAQSVMKFMNEEMRIPDYRMTAGGYGDSRPISNNKTVEGRAKNRRIDLIITPSIDDLEF